MKFVFSIKKAEGYQDFILLESVFSEFVFGRPVMNWKDFTRRNVVDFCNQIGSRTFCLKDFIKAKIDAFQHFKPNNNHIEAKIRQQLQVLRDTGIISFLDNSGHYTLRGIDLLEPEKKELQSIDVSGEIPERREYLVETYVRNITWAKKAREIFGEYCLYRKCRNTFLKDDGTRYIEVHHIIPLCNGGEDGIWNMSVLCAHHHRMAHFSDAKTRITMENYLLKEVEQRL
ncbi:MAG: HNH endonuclease [Phycisphaerae bacterium]|nr:HNH endonuclease [Phycisphaerae bacterium]